MRKNSRWNEKSYLYSLCSRHVLRAWVVIVLTNIPLRHTTYISNQWSKLEQLLLFKHNRIIQYKMTLFPGTALVTGAASGKITFISWWIDLTELSGIGRDVAISFAREGCRKIAILDRNQDELHKTASLIKDISDEILVKELIIDLQDEMNIAQQFQAALSEFGRIDYAVNCAGKSTTTFCSF